MNTPQKLSALLSAIDEPIASVLDDALEGKEISAPAALLLTSATGTELHALCLVADAIRTRQVGDVVTYVINRNINFTNVCIKHCGFCAFSREHRGDEGYFLSVDEVVRRVLEARSLGATEVCLQAGLPPGLDGNYYVDLCRSVKQAAPDVHIHAFSPEEVLYGAVRARSSIADYLAALKDAGLGTLPGTSAEILDDEVRDVLAKGRITTAQWIDVITTAHRLGIRTSSTMMYGHVETPSHQVRHMDLIRRIQKETGGFTEFVPLSFVSQEAPMAQDGITPGMRAGPTGVEVVRVHAIARLMLGEALKNIQASWVKDGLKLGQILLSAGANDLGGTLINESISTTAGAEHGQLVPPKELRRAIREAGRVPAERSTVYAIRKVYEGDDIDEESPLDRVKDAEATFGSYHSLVRSGAFRYVKPKRADEASRAVVEGKIGWRKIIGIVGGTGKQGMGLAQRWAGAHDVMIGSRDRERAASKASEGSAKVGHVIRSGSNEEVVRAADIVALCVPYDVHTATITELAPALAGKIILDMTVPLEPPRVTVVHLPKGGSAALETQAIVGSSGRVVAALHSVSSVHLADLTHTLEGDVLVCGDDAEAKAAVIDLIAALGMRGVDAGALANAVAAEALTPVLLHINKRYKVRGAGLKILGIP